ncbi:FecR domain-containing protein [Pseudomonas turukhanskensis]|uniref:Sensor n=1 Tax=Pseudomonas turukhanskensis TaxID=1806536 RepID=A0A9W6NGB1_9PSED|nr:FecR domain-containing protein [Pseudomonas turukhanskensis]GLK89516.1 sensor [Pseudomonas turukhanskensis]
MKAPALDYAVLQQAADWFATLSGGAVSEPQRQAWRLWLAASPEHAAAWQRVEAISGQFERVPGDRRRAAGQALSAAGSSRRRAIGMLALLCGGGLLALATARRGTLQAWAANQRTATGEVRETRLADGTQLWLNTNSAADIDYSASLRRVQVLRGEVLLESAHDTLVPARPLVVDSQQGRMRALGTRFSVRQGEGYTQLSVFDGAVQISPVQGAAQQVISAGQQVRFTAAGIGAVQAAEPGRQAWSHGVLLADNRRLDDFIAELAEYTPGYLGCDPQIADLRLVGAYPLADREKIFAALQSSLPVRIRHRTPWWTVVEPRTDA